MNLCAALKTNRPFRRHSAADRMWFLSVATEEACRPALLKGENGCTYTIHPPDLLAEDWEIEPHVIRLTYGDFWNAYSAAMKATLNTQTTWKISNPSASSIVQAMANSLGLGTP